jgi:hypothetical protein
MQQSVCNVSLASLTTNKQDGRGGGVLWIILILVVAIGYEAFDAASRFAGMNANDTLHREE